uniref:Adaptor related protein complex 1 subunit sigma 2 n=1 Tax=Anolis carolinensis TaxID=28377 RepID=A0A803TFE5_ANOCA|nr:PREDICTED: AP-1 complex subunit sigma-2 isoform X2 [Anolis carolinensis]|eukprot:XP_016847870.1 PREDICTED: AP-1 complex subunit sigma-2 isoform X2 [Anolis carolinensis]
MKFGGLERSVARPALLLSLAPPSQRAWATCREEPLLRLQLLGREGGRRLVVLRAVEGTSFPLLPGCHATAKARAPTAPGERYASLYFCCAIEDQDNELITLEIIHRYVELLDKYFGSVCELDIIFNFEKAYFILDEFLLGGEVQETSKKNVLKAIEQADLLQEEAETPRSVLEEIGLT